MSIDIGAEFMLDLGKKVDDLHTWKSRKATAVWDQPFAIALPLAAGAVSFDGGTQLSPQAGQTWSVRRLTLQFITLTSGTFQILLDGQEPVVSLTAGATAVNGPLISYFGRGELILTNTSKLTVAGTGVAGSPALYGRADVFESWYLAEYLG